MNLDLSNVVSSANDNRLNIRIPKTMNPDLAYLLGVQVGYGYLKQLRRGTTTDYRICYDGNRITDKVFFSLIIKKLIMKLFNKEVEIILSRGSVQISF